MIEVSLQIVAADAATPLNLTVLVPWVAPKFVPSDGHLRFQLHRQQE